MHFQRSLVFTIFATRLYSVRGVFFAPLNDSVFILCKCKWPHETSELNALKKRFTKQDWIGFGMCVEHWPFYSWFVACHSHWLTQAASFFFFLSRQFSAHCFILFQKDIGAISIPFWKSCAVFLVLAEIKCVFMISILIRFFLLVSVVCWRWLSHSASTHFVSVGFVVGPH